MVNQNPCARNIPLFIAFRVLFNARWYYPVNAVLFLDLGLTVEQFALLNVAWAAAIVGLEVPSGVLADRFGRRRMVVIAAWLMVMEMLVFAFAPRGNPTMLFVFFLVNRLLSGAAEAAASGSDEALAYDSLPAEGREKSWPEVLARLMRWQYAGFFVAMMLGAAAYDAGFVQRVIDFVGLPWRVTAQMTAAFPLYLTLGNAVVAVVMALKMREPVAPAEASRPASTGAWIFATARWLLATPAVLGVIAIGVCFDSVVRVFQSYGSNYYRLIELPGATFGLIGSASAALGFLVPGVARWMVGRWPMRWNFAAVAVLIFGGFLGCAAVWPVWGLVWMVPLSVAMSFTAFFVSHYLNLLVTDSSRRATILSFSFLAYNLAFGCGGLFFAALTYGLGSRLPPGTAKDVVFTHALGWLPWYFAATMVLLVVAGRMKRFR